MGDDVFAVINVRRYRILIVIFITLLIVLGLMALPNFILKSTYPKKYEDLVWKYAQDFNLDPYLVLAIIKAESNFNPSVESHKGAKGLMQLIDRTSLWGAEQLKLKDFNVRQTFEPETNIRIGCWYLDNLMNEFNQDVLLVLAAYNGGSGNVSKWLKDKNLNPTGQKLEQIPFKETDEYVKRVVKNYNIYKKLYEKDSKHF